MPDDCSWQYTDCAILDSSIWNQDSIVMVLAASSTSSKFARGARMFSDRRDPTRRPATARDWASGLHLAHVDPLGELWYQSCWKNQRCAYRSYSRSSQ